MKYLLVTFLAVSLAATVFNKNQLLSVDKSPTKQKLNLASLCKVSHKRDSDADKICKDYRLINKIGTNKKTK